MHDKSPNSGADWYPMAYPTPVLLDFLEDDSIFLEAESATRIKSKTEFVKRDRIESSESNKVGIDGVVEKNEELNGG
jgi:hypothetical protein